MIRYWSSKTRNTEKFVRKLDLPCESIKTPPNGPFVIVTPTIGAGECPKPVVEYMREHHAQCIGAIVGGNRNFGVDFAGAARMLHNEFGTRTLWRFELAGTQKDIEICRRGILTCLR